MDKRLAGRPKTSDAAQAQSVSLAHVISHCSGLSAATLEELFSLAGSPAGNSWARYKAGTRTMSASVRERVVKIAKKRGWIDSALVKEMCPWDGHTSLESLTSNLKVRERIHQQLLQARSRLIDAIDDFNDKLQQPLTDGFLEIPHHAYVRPKTFFDETFGEIEVEQLSSTHDAEFILELQDIKEKIACVTTVYPWLNSLEKNANGL
jgi:hypothetical protein